MLCSIDDYFLADGTLAGGYSLTGLRLAMHRIFDVVVPISAPKDHGILATGMAYRIVIYQSGDDFTNIGGSNVTGNVFVATGTTPADWTNLSVLLALSPTLIDRNKRKVEITFNVQRVQTTITDAEDFCLIHEATIPRTGDIKLIPTTGMDLSPASNALVVNGDLLSHELVKQIGSFTEHSYHIVGSPIFAPSPGEFIITEGGDFILTESSDKIIVE
jgi:hypothetical protein